MRGSKRLKMNYKVNNQEEGTERPQWTKRIGTGALGKGMVSSRDNSLTVARVMFNYSKSTIPPTVFPQK